MKKKSTSSRQKIRQAKVTSLNASHFTDGASFPIVGIGASAGGLEAL